MPTAFITGISGQDGSYLAELLLTKGYSVHGLVRRSSQIARPRIDHLHDSESSGGIELHDGDLDASPRSDSGVGGADTLLPGVVVGDVGISCPARIRADTFPSPQPLRRCKGVRLLGHGQRPRGLRHVHLQGHPLQPRVTSPRENSVTRKITRGVADIVTGRAGKLRLGNLDAKRVWGFVGDYVDGMWRMLQHDQPVDFVLATGEAHSVREFCDIAFSHVGLDYNDHVVVDERFFRPSEVDYLLGDASKARNVLGREPTTAFTELVTMMVDADITASGADARQ